MTYQDFRSTHQPRGKRLNQPQLKEARKQALPAVRVQMPSGAYVTEHDFHRFRSTSHMKFVAFSGISERVKAAIPALEWKLLLAWIDSRRGGYRNVEKQNDGLIAVLIDHAASQKKRRPEDVYAEIIRDGTAQLLLSNKP